MSSLSKIKFVVWFPVIGLSILFVALYSPELFGYSLWLSYSDRMNLVLTVALAMFAAIEAYSTYQQAYSSNQQVMLQDRKNLIDDARNELEKAYGPINSLLNKPVEKDESFIKLSVGEKMKLDEIVTSYPFMFSEEINTYWQNNIRNLETQQGLKVDVMTFLRGGSPFAASTYVDEYHIPLEFATIFNSAYKKKVQSYNELLKKLESKPLE
jgi:hypothetical protein